MSAILVWDRYRADIKLHQEPDPRFMSMSTGGGQGMTKGRMEAFSDGVIAVIITIMVLEMKPPEGTSLSALRPLLPVFLSYVMSFVYVGIYWNNHHHLL